MPGGVALAGGALWGAILPVADAEVLITEEAVHAILHTPALPLVLFPSHAPHTASSKQSPSMSHSCAALADIQVKHLFELGITERDAILWVETGVWADRASERRPADAAGIVHRCLADVGAVGNAWLGRLCPHRTWPYWLPAEAALEAPGMPPAGRQSAIVKRHHACRLAGM